LGYMWAANAEDDMRRTVGAVLFVTGVLGLVVCGPAAADHDAAATAARTQAALGPAHS